MAERVDGATEDWQERLFLEGRARWPQVVVERETFAGYVADKHGSVPVALRGDGLYLACACVHEAPRAVAVLLEAYRERLLRALGRFEPSVSVEEILQRLNERLFVSKPERPAAIGKYDGTGELGSWLVAVATREGYRLARGRTPPGIRASALEDAAAHVDPEVDYLKGRYRQHFRAAFRKALDALEATERNVLRLLYVDRFGYEAIAELYGLSRTTAARRIASAKKQLLAGTRAHLRDAVGCDDQELDSVMRLIRSQFDVTAGALFRTNER